MHAKQRFQRTTRIHFCKHTASANTIMVNIIERSMLYRPTHCAKSHCPPGNYRFWWPNILIITWARNGWHGSYLVDRGLFCAVKLNYLLAYHSQNPKLVELYCLVVNWIWILIKYGSSRIAEHSTICVIPYAHFFLIQYNIQRSLCYNLYLQCTCPDYLPRKRAPLITILLSYCCAFWHMRLSSNIIARKLTVIYVI